MSATIMEGRLLAALNNDALLKHRGCDASASPEGGVAIERRGHHLGLWRWHGGFFELTLAATLLSSAEMETVAEAVLYTRERFFTT